MEKNLKNKILFFGLTILIIVLFVSIFYLQNKTAALNVDEEGVSTINQKGLNNLIHSVEASEISEKEIESILFMLEEEKLAKDVYIVLSDKWDIKSFNNIAAAESTHMDAVKFLIDNYNIDSQFSEEIGVFNNEKLQILYNNLIEQGSSSEVEALRVGAAIEEIDILDLKKYVAEIENGEIIIVYENLMRGSRNHLRAFVSQLGKHGEKYEPQYLDDKEYETIINSGIERGN